MKNLKLKMEKQLQAAIDETEGKNHRFLVEEMRKCEKAHLVEVGKFRNEIEKRESEYEALKNQICEKESVQKKTETKLQEVADAFQQFIDVTNGFTKGQSEFLLPDINLLQDMLKGAVSCCKK